MVLQEREKHGHAPFLISLTFSIRLRLNLTGGLSLWSVSGPALSTRCVAWDRKAWPNHPLQLTRPATLLPPTDSSPARAGQLRGVVRRGRAHGRRYRVPDSDPGRSV